MNELKIELSRFGRNLGSRNLGEVAFDHFRGEILCANEVVIDFDKIDKMTLSFGTEFFDSIYSLEKRVTVVNANSFVSRLVDFCLSNQKIKKELVLN